MLAWHGWGAAWQWSLWPLLNGALYSAALVKGVDAWEQWRQNGRVELSCSCKYCIWSIEGCRNPSLAASCEWEACKECAAFAITAGKTNCLTAPMYDPRQPRTVARMSRLVTDKLRDLQAQA
eukprot:SAG22_NODE_1598_length_4032_cov_1.979405_2_plen_122_part_00